MTNRFGLYGGASGGPFLCPPFNRIIGLEAKNSFFPLVDDWSHPGAFHWLLNGISRSLIRPIISLLLPSIRLPSSGNCVKIGAPLLIDTLINYAHDDGSFKQAASMEAISQMSL